MKIMHRITGFLLVAILLAAMLPTAAAAAETYGYEVDIAPSPVTIGSTVTLTFRLTDYTDAKSGIRGFQIDITDVDDVLHEAVCTPLVTDTENLLTNVAKYQSKRDLVRHAYTKMSGALSYDNSNLLEVKFTIPETYTEAGTLSLPLQILIQNEAGDKLTYKDTIVISYVPSSESPSEPGTDVVSVDVTWGAMAFTYTDGAWDPRSCTYAGAGWADDGTGYVTVKNTGASPATATLSYQTDRKDIAGSFTNGTDAITDPLSIGKGEEITVYLRLTGKPEEILDNAVIGTVTVRIGGE